MVDQPRPGAGAAELVGVGLARHPAAEIELLAQLFPAFIGRRVNHPIGDWCRRPPDGHPRERLQLGRLGRTLRTVVGGGVDRGRARLEIQGTVKQGLLAQPFVGQRRVLDCCTGQRRPARAVSRWAQGLGLGLAGAVEFPADIGFLGRVNAVGQFASNRSGQNQ